MFDEQLKEKIETIIEYDTNVLRRESGDFQFTDVSNEINELHRFIEELSKTPEFFTNLPSNLQTDLVSRINNVAESFSQISNFDPTQVPNPQEVRNQIAQSVTHSYRDLYDFINNLELYLLRVSGKQAELSNITKEAKKTLLESKKSLKEIDSLASTAKKTASKVPLYKYIGIFSETAKKHLITAIIFGIASLFGAFGLVKVLYSISTDLSDKILQLENIQAVFALVIAKLFFLAVLVYVLQQLVRNYMANMHQFVLNRHRENSLSVFDAMVTSTETKEIADQVLSQLSKSIFEAGDTGFFPGKDISKDGPDIVQVFRDIGKPK